MKVVRLPTQEGRDWWVVVHELTLAQGRMRKLRPIHTFTFLAPTIDKNNILKMFSSCLALENKLFGVRFYHLELKKAIAATAPQIYQGYVKDYDDQQTIICILEAYLNAIYTALEITAQINKILYPQLPTGFRRQSKKFDSFSFMTWRWLPHFYDLRTELVHYGSPLPTVSEGKLVIDFTQNRQLEMAQKGKHETTLSSILSYSIELFNMLDEWAKFELTKINQEEMLDSLNEVGLNIPLKNQKIKAKEILDLLK